MPMKRDDLIQHLRWNMEVPGSMACIGCVRENSCSTRGCRILREAADQLAVDATLMEFKDNEIAKLREAVDRQAEELEFLHQRVEADKQTIVTMGQSLEKMAKEKSQIVHCGDPCLYFDGQVGEDGFCKRKMLGLVRCTDSCSFGERREEAEE